MEEKYGNVIEEFHAPSKNKLIIIQDFHCNPDVQKNIYKIIKSITEHVKSFIVIGAEGTPVSRIDTGILDAIKDTKIKNTIIQNLLSSGKLKGEELFMLYEKPEDIELYGLENSEIYNQNFKLLLKSQENNIAIKPILNELSRKINYVGNKIFLQNILNLIKTEQAYMRSKMSLSDYITSLIAASKNYNIFLRNDYKNLQLVLNSQRIRKLTNLSVVNIEAVQLEKALLNHLNNDQKRVLLNYSKNKGKNYFIYLNNLIKLYNFSDSEKLPNLHKYLNYLELQNSIDFSKLIEELNDFQFEIGLYMTKGTGFGEKLWYLRRYINLLEKYLFNNITHYQYEKWNSEKQIFLKELKRFANKFYGPKYFEKIKHIIYDSIDTMESFYLLADKRDEVLTQNMLRLLTTFETNKSTIGIMIAGGFHIRGITKNLRSRAVAYDVIIPSMPDKISKKLYLERINEQADLYTGN
ncbi:hypothetical protein ACFL4A_04225 [bacterium]